MRVALGLAAVLAAACSHAGGSGQTPSSIVSMESARVALAEYNLEGEVALQGYDPVSYFPEGGGAPKPGSTEHSLRYRGVVYRFETRANKRRFEATPARYEPAYGGWCAWAMASGYRVKIDPDNFTITDATLRLFYRNPLVDTRNKWMRGDYSALARNAASHWRERSGEPRPDS